MNAHDLSKAELALMRHVFKSPEGVFIGGIVSSTGISIKDAANAFRKLRGIRLLREQSGSLILTKRGRMWIMKHQHLFAFSGEKNWRKVPEEFRTDAIQAFEPYAPRISKLDKRYFVLGGR